jgi:hypothetical protein
MYPVRFEALTVAIMKVAVFWDVSPRSVLEIDRRFRVTASITLECTALYQISSSSHEVMIAR